MLVGAFKINHWHAMMARKRAVFEAFKSDYVNMMQEGYV
jgi:hypothetical protein